MKRVLWLVFAGFVAASSPLSAQEPELQDAKAYCDRGVAHADKGEYDKAIADDTEAIRLNPKLTSAYCNRGAAYGEKGECDKEIADETEAIRLDPINALAYQKRGVAYGKKSEYEKAIADFTEAIQLAPRFAAAHNGLAWLLATCPEEHFRDGPRAIDHATQACELRKWKNWGYLDTLAAAYAEAGKFDKAVEFQQKALDLGTKDAAKHDLRERLKLYQDDKPYRETVKKK